MVNLIQARNDLRDFFNKTKINVDFLVNDDGCLKVKGNVTLKDLDDDIMIIMGIYENGSFYFDLIFDKLHDRDNAYSIINDINDNFAWVKAYIRNDDYFVLRYTTLDMFNENLASNVEYLLNYFASDDLYQYLKQICTLTQ